MALKKFNKIVGIDNTKINQQTIEELSNFSEEKVKVYTDYPETNQEIISRIGNAEAVLVSWKTILEEHVLKKCPNLKYIGMCCSLYDEESANVAIGFAKKNNIAVSGIQDYGDPGVVEFIISESVRLLHGYGKNKFQEMPLELSGRKFGIIGLGTTGKLLAESLLTLGTDLYYFSRSRKPEWEKKGVKFQELDELLKKVDILSIHLPKNTKILKHAQFEHFGMHKILINTSLGLPFEEKAFKNWIQKTGNFAIFDGDGKAELSSEIENFKNIISYSKSAGWSEETKARLSQKVLDNVKQYFKA